MKYVMDNYFQIITILNTISILTIVVIVSMKKNTSQNCSQKSQQKPQWVKTNIY